MNSGVLIGDRMLILDEVTLLTTKSSKLVRFALSNGKKVGILIGLNIDIGKSPLGYNEYDAMLLAPVNMLTDK